MAIIISTVHRVLFLLYTVSQKTVQVLFFESWNIGRF